MPSYYTKGTIQDRLGVPPDRIIVCSPGAPPWTAREEPPPGGPILFVGTVEPRKNIPGLLGAYAALVGDDPSMPDLVIAGRAPSGLGLDLTIDGVSIEGRVQVPGYVDDARRLSLYRAASMLVLPSFDEGFGLPVLEAMTLGVPVVAANRGSLPEVLGGAGILVDPDDHDGAGERDTDRAPRSGGTRQDDASGSRPGARPTRGRFPHGASTRRTSRPWRAGPPRD